jgi:hypothetical protein
VKPMKMFPRRLLLASIAVAASAFILLPTAASAACQAYRVLPKFAIKQSNGIPVTLSLKANRRGEVNGSAHYMSGSDFRRTVGEIEGGSFDGRVLKFNIVWSGSAPATYEGAIDGKGILSGAARWGANNTASFKSIQSARPDRGPIAMPVLRVRAHSKNKITKTV